MNKNLIIILILIALVGVGFVFAKENMVDKRTQSNEEATKKATPSKVQSPADKNINSQYSASFAIFTNGTFRVFTASMYHNQSGEVFIESANPNIIQVRKAGVTWDDFFKTLPFKLTKNCLTTGTNQTFCTGNNEELRFYVNGNEDPNVLDKKINRGDKMLVSYGQESKSEIDKQIQQIPSAD